MARRTSLQPKAEYICADLSSRPNFPLQSCGGPYILGTYLSATITDELTQSPKDRYRADVAASHSTHSIRPKSLYRINRSRPARRDKSSHYGTNRQEQNCANERERIVGFHFVKKASHEMAGNQCRGNTNREANEELPKCAPQHHGYHA